MARCAAGSVWLVFSLGLALVLGTSCGAPSQHATPQAGSLSMMLTGTSTSGVPYRLRHGTFNITGSSSASLSTEDDPAAETVDVELPIGSYSVSLASGWFLERANPNGAFERVEATLASSDTQSFTIVAQQTTQVRYRFSVAGEVIGLEGGLSIGIEVEEIPVDGGCQTICSEPPCARGPSLDLVTESGTSTVHATRQDVMPAPGERTIILPPLSENISVSADGRALPQQVIADPNVTETQVRVTVPAGTSALRVAYDILDGTLPYEGRWYLRHPLEVAGPRQICIQLPPDATIERLDWPDIDPAAQRVEFQIADGTAEPFLVYTTPVVPDLYDHIDTPHFAVNLAQAHRRYQPAILGLLENLYALYGEYTAQDANQIQGQQRYSYSFPPSHWRWGGVYEIGGGLSVKGTSAVNGALVPQIGLPTSNGFNPMVAITAHELGNGWWGTWEEPDADNRTPSWINNEGHSGFLRAQGELDLGYCQDARRENDAHYADFVNCTAECGGETVLVSLQDRFGWAPFRAFYAAVQSHAFDFRGLTEVERSSIVIRFFSEQVSENLAPFFDLVRISMTQAVRDELGRRFAPVDVPVVRDLSCRPQQLRVAPSRIEALVSESAASGQAVAYACAPDGWSATLSASSGLSLQTSPTNNCGTATVTADLTRTGFGELGQLNFSAPGVGGSPQTRTVSFTSLHDILKNGNFEQPFDADWTAISWQPNATYALDARAPRRGQSALRIESTEVNDARLIQTVTVKAGTRYRLSGWIRTENVQEGLGASLTIEWPGQGWSTSRPVTGTSDWTFVEVEVDSGSATSFEAQTRLGHYGATSRGRAWFDDLQLNEIP